MPYEVIKHLPFCIHMLLFNLLKLCWKSGYTPAGWLHSFTHLFLKRQPATDLDNYRPIATHKTLLKIWTRLVAHVLQAYAEKHGILSHSQEGFRQGRNAGRALQYFTLALEDAAATSATSSFSNSTGSKPTTPLTTIICTGSCNNWAFRQMRYRW